jgi:hypothetical protein
VDPRERPGRALAFETRAGTLQRAVDGGDALAEEVGDFARPPSEDVAQDEDRALARRQELDGDHEREPDVLARDGLLARLALRRAQLVEEAVRIWLEAGVHLHGAIALAPLDEAQRDVGRDAVQPRLQRSAGLVAGQPAPRAQQRLLQGVVGVVHRAEHPVAMCVELGSVRFDQLGEAAAGRFGTPVQGCSTTIRTWPVGSRNQNNGGTGSPIRDTWASTSTPRDWNWAWVASMSSVVRVMPVCIPSTSPLSGGGGASAIPVVPAGGYTSTQR